MEAVAARERSRCPGRGRRTSRSRKVMATTGALGSPLLDVLAAHRACAPFRPRHQPDEREEHEAKEPDQQDQSYAYASARVACVFASFQAQVRTRMRFTVGRRVTARAPGDSPDEDQH